MYVLRESIRENVADEVSGVASRSLGDREVQEKAAGLAAALRGDLLIPALPPFAPPEQDDFVLKFAEGAALGFARGQDRLMQLQVKLRHDLDRSESRE